MQHFYFFLTQYNNYKLISLFIILFHRVIIVNKWYKKPACSAKATAESTATTSGKTEAEVKKEVAAAPKVVVCPKFAEQFNAYLASEEGIKVLDAAYAYRMSVSARKHAASKED